MPLVHPAKQELLGIRTFQPTFKTVLLCLFLFFLDHLVGVSHLSPCMKDEGAACMGECALMPRMLGASWKLLNGDNFAVYFKGMPTYRGQVSSPDDQCL